MAAPEIDLNKCIGCGNCAEECPAGIVIMVNGRAVIVSPEECDYCASCEEFCPSGAIRCPFEIITAREAGE